jgi:hypothetical protein
MADASRIICLSRIPKSAAMPTAPPTDDAALLPRPLPGFMPFLMVIENPDSAEPQSSANFNAE